LKAFSWPVRVYWEDTDGGGIVYYANYLRFLERARSEWLRELGYRQSELASQLGLVFVVSSVRIDYRRPARLDDELEVHCRAHARRSANIVFAQQIVRGDELIAAAQVSVVCVDSQRMKPTRMPEILLRQLTREEPMPA